MTIPFFHVVSKTMESPTKGCLLLKHTLHRNFNAYWSCLQNTHFPFLIEHAQYSWKHYIHMWLFFSFKADSISSLVSALKLWENLHFKDNYVWAPMALVHRVKKMFYIMNVVFWLLSVVSEVTMTNICIIQVNSSKSSTINIHTYIHTYLGLSFKCASLHIWNIEPYFLKYCHILFKTLLSSSSLAHMTSIL